MIKQSKSGHTLTILLCGVYFSIVCRDFAVLEDHCLAHNLQEQESEYAGISQEILFEHVLEKKKFNDSFGIPMWLKSLKIQLVWM